MKKMLFLLLALLTVCLVTEAQFHRSFKNIGLEEGLSNVYVRDIAIDDDGFVWVATENGLNRISGNQCVNMKWRPEIFDGKTLTSLYYEPVQRKLWIGSHRGVAIYDCETQQFKKLGQKEGVISRDVASITKATDGGLWITFANGIIQHYNVKKDAFTNYDYGQITRKKSPLFFCTDDGNGHLYICTSEEGLVVLDVNTNKSTAYVHYSDNPHSIPSNQSRCVFIDHLKNVWVATKNGLSLFDRHTGSFTNFHHIPDNDQSLCGENIFSITEFDGRYLWVTSDLGGISILDLETLSRQGNMDLHFMNITDDNSDLTSSCVRTVKQDPFGNIWVASYSAGVDFIDASPFAFNIFPYYKERFQNQELKRVYGIKKDRSGHIWMGGECEVSEFADGKLLHTWKTDQYLSVINTLEIDHLGIVWLGMNDVGIICLNPKTGKFYKVGQGFEKNDIHALHEDETGKMWIGFDNGLFSYENGEVHEEDSYNRQMDTRSILTMLFDKNRNLWIGTGERGLYVFDKNGRLRSHLMHTKGFPSSSINHIYEDKDGGIWVATFNGLIYMADGNHPEKYVVYNENHGLRDNHIRAIQQDRNGNMWVSTYKYIACLNVSKKKFNNYDYNNNIPRGGFVEGGTIQTDDGTIYFTSPQGVCYFNPHDINDKQTVSPVHIISLEGISASMEPDSEKTFLPDRNGEISLKYDQNTFTVLFTVANHSQVGDVEYMYQMKGLDEKWYNTNGSDGVAFRNLSAGHYTFTIRAKLKNMDWEDATNDQITIVVRPPFWLTWWAKLSYLLLITGIILYYLRSYKRKLQLKNSLLLAQRENLQKEELHEERLRFFTNITHELRTPLTLIVGPLEDLMDDKRLPEVYHKKIELISKSAERLQNLINDILEFRKTETQNRKLCVAKESLKALVSEIGLHFKELNRNTKVSVNVMVDHHVPDIYFDLEVLTTILNNLLSNAMKYTPEGKVSLMLTTSGERTSIVVSDTGYGISKDALPHIFDRYYQAKGKHQASGTGIGLALVKALADLHEAELSVESEVGKGSTFTFSLLTHNAYPNALHKTDESEDKDRIPSTETVPGEAELEAPFEIDENQRPLLLVVEDNDNIRQYIADSMGEDYRIIQAKNGREGVLAAFEHIPDILVSDIMMPEMDGITLTKTLKDDVRTSHIPIILLTAKDTINDKEEGYDSGADSYLTKPFSAKLLHSRIQNFLNARRRLAELIMLRNMSNVHQDLQETVQDHQQELPEAAPILSKLDQEFINKLNGIILDNLLKVDIDMAFLTDRMAMSHSTFYRKVKALTGMTAVEYIRKMKLKRSIVLLQSGEYNVTEAAMMAGFNNMGHFRDSFKKEFGINPSEVLKK